METDHGLVVHEIILTSFLYKWYTSLRQAYKYQQSITVIYGSNVMEFIFSIVTKVVEKADFGYTHDSKTWLAKVAYVGAERRADK